MEVCLHLLQTLITKVPRPRWARLDEVMKGVDVVWQICKKQILCIYIYIFTQLIQVWFHIFICMRICIDTKLIVIKYQELVPLSPLICRVKRSHLDIHHQLPHTVESRPWMMGSWKFLHRSCLVCTRRSLEDLSISWTRLLEEHGGNVGRRSFTGSTKTKR